MSSRTVAFNTIPGLVLLVLFGASIVFARRNVLAGRADVRGAVRLALMMWAIGTFAFMLFSEPHLPLGAVLIAGILNNLYYTAFYATSYLAVEPLVRRLHPAWLTAWTRLLSGRVMDPLVGRNVLIGALAGVVMTLVTSTYVTLSRFPAGGDYQAAAIGGLTAFSVALRGVNYGVLGALMFVMVLAALQLSMRRERLALVPWFAFIILLSFASGRDLTLGRFVATIGMMGIWSISLWRAGILGGATAFSVYAMINEEYLTTQLGAWYAGVTIAALFLIGALVVWGFIAATRGRKLAEAQAS